MDLVKRPAIVILGVSAHPLAKRIAGLLGDAEIHGLSRRVAQCDVAFDDAATHLQEIFTSGRAIIAIMSAGALTRLVAPALADKATEPPVLSVAADASSVVPLLGGHHGANDLARMLAEGLDGHAAITTAGDVRFGVALDAPPEGWRLANPASAKTVMAGLLESARVTLEGDAPWITASSLEIGADAPWRITVTEKVHRPADNELLYHPGVLAVGVGCERGCDPQELVDLVQATLAEHGLSASSVALVASIGVKSDERAVHALADTLGVPARFFPAARLEQEAPRLANPSELVFAEVGCHGVAEGAALAAAGAESTLVVAKTKSRRATCAVAMSPSVIDVSAAGRPRGSLAVVGLGPGKQDWRSPQAADLIRGSDHVVGYSLYIDLAADLLGDRKRHDFPLGGEEDRVRHALELAGEGEAVSLVCSGDAGIYAMAALVYELLDRAPGEGGVSDEARRVAITVAPGISALQAAAATTGAPLGHDFCTISLSDLLTPWPVIETRVRAAAQGDFVIAFYNPVSMRRRTQLAQARDILLGHRPPETPVILASNLGRPGEACRVVTLGSLEVDDVDMLTVVIVGSRETRTLMRGDGTTNVFTPRGYAAKLEKGAAE